MSRNLPAIRGAGGGGSSSGGQELTDTLHSTQIADIVDLLSEGEMQGPVNGFQSIYLDGVPLMNADQTFNFQNVRVNIAYGTQAQESIYAGDGVQTEVGVAVDVTAAAPVVRTITNPAVDTLRVTITVPQLSAQNTSTGDLGGSSFVWAVEVQSNGGGYVEVLRDTVDGKTMSRYSRAKSFKLVGPAPWDVRVKRITADSGSSAVVNAFLWTSYTQIQSLRLRNPNSAMVRLQFDAQQFSRIPTRSFDLLGIRIQVPTNYDPMTRVYTGVWNGSFKVAWTDNPAWMFHDIVVNNRYGLGRYFQGDDSFKWDLYAIARYCDGMVPDGKGGMEPRFRAGFVLSTREQAYKVLTDMAAIFRGIAYWMAEDVAVIQDAPSDPVALFTPANVVGGTFTYSGASHSKRHSSVVVWFNSLADQGKLVPEVVFDRAMEARYGVKPLEVSPLGVWSRGQAHRIGRWVLYSEQKEGGAVVFRVGLDGVLVPPGKVFEIADPKESGERLGGRIRSATSAIVTLDAEVLLRSGESYTLAVMVQDPGDPAKLMMQKRGVTTAAGAAGSIAVSPAYTTAPAAASVWVLESDAVQATTWRCIGLSEVKGSNDFEITALAHAPQKFDLIERGIQFQAPSISRIVLTPPAPTNLVLTETVYLAGAIAQSRETVSWQPAALGLTYAASWRLNGGPWTDVQPTSSNSFEVEHLSRGVFEVSVVARNVLNNRSPALFGSAVLHGKTTRPSNVAGFTATVVQGGVRFAWVPATDADYLSTQLKVGSTTILFDGAASSWTWTWPPIGIYAVTATHFDTSLNESATPAGVSFVIDENIEVQWGGILGKPLDQFNMVLTPQFEGNDARNWPGTVVPVIGQAWKHALQVSRRDSDEAGQAIPVRAGEVLFCAADLDASTSNFAFAFGGHFVDADGGNIDWRAGVSVPAGTAWRRGIGPMTVPARAVCMHPWLQMNGSYPAAFGTARATNLYIGRAQPGATIGFVDVALVARGVVLSGNTATKETGAAAWDSDVYSQDSFVGGAYASVVIGSAPFDLMFGLNTDPALDADWASIDYAIYFRYDGVLDVRESGITRDLGNPTYQIGDVLAVTYDGAKVTYLKNGISLRTVPAPTGLRMYFDSSFYSVGATVKNIRFGPMTDISGALAAAAAAAAAASNAQAAADTANGSIGAIASDNVLTSGEKSEVILDVNVIENELGGIQSQAYYYGVTTELTNYINAVNALNSYLSILTSPVAWNNVNGSTSIDGPTFRNYFSNVYLSRQAVLNMISQVAKARLGGLATLNTVGTAQIDPNAATDVYSATTSNVSVTALSGPNSFPWTDLNSISFAASVAADVLITCDGSISIQTPDSSAGFSAQYAEISTRIMVNGSILGRACFAMDSKVGYNAIAQGTLVRSIRIGIIAGTTYTVILQAQKLDFNVTTLVSSSMRVEVVKR